MNDARVAHSKEMAKSLDNYGQLSDNDATPKNKVDTHLAEYDDDNGDDEDDYGPKLPSGPVTSKGALSGPTIPNIQDLELRRGTYSIYFIQCYLFLTNSCNRTSYRRR